MSTVEAILSIPQSISNWFGMLLQRITTIGQSIIDFISYALDILKAIYFGMVSLVSGLWDLIVDFFSGGAIANMLSTINSLSEYIGGPATVFIVSLLSIIMLRIFIGFIFKVLRLNIDYHTLNSKTSRWNQKDRFGI